MHEFRSVRHGGTSSPVTFVANASMASELGLNGLAAFKQAG